MAFGNGEGAASPAVGTVAQRGLGWASSSNRVITVLVLGLPLLLIAIIHTRQGYSFFHGALTNQNSDTVPVWANVGGHLLAYIGDAGFLLLLVILAAVSEEAGALAAAILAALWVAYLLGNGPAALSHVTGMPPATKPVPSQGGRGGNKK